MKKFIIAIVFLFLIAILISFNYLLWDRERQMESYQNMKQSNNLTIETLSEKMSNLDKLNKELTTKLETITDENATIKENLTVSNKEKVELQKEIELRNNLILALKKSINPSSMQAVIKKWTEAINAKNYENAKTYISKNSEDEALSGDVKELGKIYQEELKEIKLKTSEPYTKLKDEEHIKKIQLKAVFEVVKPATGDKEPVSESIFKNGINEKYITMEFDLDTDKWLMLEIKNEP